MGAKLWTIFRVGETCTLCVASGIVTDICLRLWAIGPLDLVVVKNIQQHENPAFTLQHLTFRYLNLEDVKVV